MPLVPDTINMKQRIWQKSKKFWRLKLINRLMIAIYGYVKNNIINKRSVENAIVWEEESGTKI